MVDEETECATAGEGSRPVRDGALVARAHDAAPLQQQRGGARPIIAEIGRRYRAEGLNLSNDHRLVDEALELVLDDNAPEERERLGLVPLRHVRTFDVLHRDAALVEVGEGELDVVFLPQQVCRGDAELVAEVNKLVDGARR